MKTITLYSPESFCQKKKGEKLKGIRMTLSFQPPSNDRVKSTVATPCPVLNIAQVPNVPKLDPEVYSFYRLLEFLSNTCKHLNMKAQPGYSKHGKLEIVGCDWKLVDWYFSNQPCRKRMRTLHPVVDGHKSTCYWIKYEFQDGILPDLGNTNYWIRYHGKLSAWGNIPLRTFYTKLAFIIRTDSNLMWCQYSRCTQAFMFGKWIDQA
jgi:hypothetical protein